RRYPRRHSAKGAPPPASCSNAGGGEIAESGEELVQERFDDLAELGIAQLAERAHLDLAHAFEADAELGRDFGERVLTLDADAEAQRDHVALAVREAAQGLA